MVGSRVLCVSRSQMLLVQHVDHATGERFWLLPGGRREPGETFEQAAVREVLEETGVAVRIVRRLRIDRPGGSIEPGVSSYALFLAEAESHVEIAPTVDLVTETYLLAAAWHPITPEQSLGPLDPRYWGFLERRLRALATKSADPYHEHAEDE